VTGLGSPPTLRSGVLALALGLFGAGAASADGAARRPSDAKARSMVVGRTFAAHGPLEGDAERAEYETFCPDGRYLQDAGRSVPGVYSLMSGVVCVTAKLGLAERRCRKLLIDGGGGIHVSARGFDALPWASAGRLWPDQARADACAPDVGQDDHEPSPAGAPDVGDPAAVPPP
jgi:hypothetical protein